MKKFTVILTRDITESCEVTVEAMDEDAATEAALALDQDALTFTSDDNFHRDDATYTTGCDEVPDEE